MASDVSRGKGGCAVVGFDGDGERAGKIRGGPGVEGSLVSCIGLDGNAPEAVVGDAHGCGVTGFGNIEAKTRGEGGGIDGVGSVELSRLSRRTLVLTRDQWGINRRGAWMGAEAGSAGC